MKVLACEIEDRANEHTHLPDSCLADVAKAKAGVKRQTKNSLEMPQQIKTWTHFDAKPKCCHLDASHALHPLSNTGAHDRGMALHNHFYLIMPAV